MDRIEGIANDGSNAPKPAQPKPGVEGLLALGDEKAVPVPVDASCKSKGKATAPAPTSSGAQCGAQAQQQSNPKRLKNPRGRGKRKCPLEKHIPKFPRNIRKAIQYRKKVCKAYKQACKLGPAANKQMLKTMKKQQMDSILQVVELKLRFEKRQAMYKLNQLRKEKAAKAGKESSSTATVKTPLLPTPKLELPESLPRKPGLLPIPDSFSASGQQTPDLTAGKLKPPLLPDPGLCVNEPQRPTKPCTIVHEADTVSQTMLEPKEPDTKATDVDERIHAVVATKPAGPDVVHLAEQCLQPPAWQIEKKPAIMGDSDEEYDRRRGRDKFRRERNDYERRDDRRPGRESWEDNRGHGGWDRRSGGDRREYRDHDRRRERYSPQGRDGSPPRFKRMRRDWEDGGGGFHYEGAFQGGPMHGGPGGHGSSGWGPSQGGDMPPPQQGFGGGSNSRGPDLDNVPTQPPMMTFKQFLSQQDDHITDEDAIKKFNEYKIDFKKQQISEFFLGHKDEEWFKSKYHPEECDRKKEETKVALKRRCDIFLKLLNTGWLEKVTCDIDRHQELVKLLDAAVILMEGGTDLDLKFLDQQAPQPEPPQRSRGESESQQAEKLPETTPRRSTSESKEEGEEGEEMDKEEGEAEEGESPAEKEKEEQPTEETPEKKPESTEEEKPLAEKPQTEETPPVNTKKRPRSYGSGSDSDSGSASDSETEATPPAGDKAPPPAAEATPTATPTTPTKPDLTEKESQPPEEKEKDVQEDGEQVDETKPRAMHKTLSIFLRNLAPSITKQEVEAMCKRYPGFIRVALQDPQPERKFYRRGWVTFDRTVNIKEICWNLNNIRLRDCEMGAIVNRELKQRVRPLNGITAHTQVAKQDIKHAAKVTQILDSKLNMWEDAEEEKKDAEKESFGLVSKNPVLKNITDYLVEEGSYEEEALLGEAFEDKPKDGNSDVTIERDEELLQVLDRMILYLRVVHSFDYYSCVEYPNEDEMPHKCGIMHARGPNPPNRLHPNEIGDWNTGFEMKVMHFVNSKNTLDEIEAIRLGKKDVDAELEKFVTANTQELAKDKWLCPLSGKKFKGPEFVRKHIFNKHAEKVEEAKKEVAFFNNYLMDAKRPQLPEHPANRGLPNPQGRNGAGYGGSQGGGYQGHQQQQMGYQPRPPMMYGNRRGGRRGGGHHYQSNYPSRGHTMYRQDRRDDRYSGAGRRDRSRPDPRGVIEYRDLDAPDDMDMF